MTSRVTQRNHRREARLRATARHRALPPAVCPHSGGRDVGAAEECGAGTGGVPRPRPGKLGIPFRFRGCEHPVTHKPHRTMTRRPRLRPGHRTLCRSAARSGPGNPPTPCSLVSRTLRALEVPIPDSPNRSAASFGPGDPSPTPWTDQGPPNPGLLGPPASAAGDALLPHSRRLAPATCHPHLCTQSRSAPPASRPQRGWRRARGGGGGGSAQGWPPSGGCPEHCLAPSSVPARPAAHGLPDARGRSSVRPSAAGSRAR